MSSVFDEGTTLVDGIAEVYISKDDEELSTSVTGGSKLFDE